MSGFQQRVIKEPPESRVVEDQPTYEQLQERLRILSQAMLAIISCPQADLAKYCKEVDSIACESLAKAVE